MMLLGTYADPGYVTPTKYANVPHMRLILGDMN